LISSSVEVLLAMAASSAPLRALTRVSALDFALGYRVPLEKRGSGFVLIGRLIVRPLGLHDTTLGHLEVSSGNLELRFHLGYAPSGALDRRLLLGAVEPEQGCALLHFLAQPDVHLRHATNGLRQDGHGAEEGQGAAGRRVEVEDHRDQGKRQQHAGRDAPAELVPH
jgi:hypothetical protein